MKITFREVVHTASRPLIQENGFTERTARRFIRQDELIRSAWFKPTSSVAGRFRFDVLFDIGLTGLSSFSSKAQLWVVRCSASQLRNVSSLPAANLELTGGTLDEQVRDYVVGACAYVYETFLLKHQTAEDLFRWLRDNAIGALNDPAVDNDFHRLWLDPSNTVRQLELAAAYAAYLGKVDEAARLESATVDYAKNHQLRYLTQEIQANIAGAASRRLHRT